MNTSLPSVPLGSEWGPPPPRRRLSGGIIAILTALALVGGLAVGAIFITLPYFAVSPGGAPTVDDLVRIERAPSYPPKGRLLFVTVSLGRVNAYGALAGWLDPDVDVVPESAIKPPGTSQKEYRRQVQQDMTDSKEIASYVALRRLGYPVTVHGDGALVQSVDASYPVKDVVRAGDVIVAADNKPVATADDLIAAIHVHRPGESMHLRVVPGTGGPPREVDARVGARDDGQPLLGVSLDTKNQRFDYPFPVHIDSGQVGGPSAGLAFTLALLDVLTPGELTGGVPVAATGTMSLEGRVGPVGGVAQKTASVRHAGARLFLVPSEEYAEAKAHAGRRLQIVKVDNVDDALHALAHIKGSNALALGTPGATIK